MGLISNGTTIFDAGSLAAGLGGSMTFIKKLTASTSATLSFVDGASSVVLDNTYNSYLFTFNNIHPSVDGEKCGFQGNAAGGSGYNETITSTFFHAAANEGGTDAGPLEYEAGYDLAQGTTFQRLTRNTGNANDECFCGWLRLFNPSDTTFVTNFTAQTQSLQANEYSDNSFIGGYFNTTSAIDEIQFKMESGNIDSGTICLYGIS
tara:strand:- start:36 stop:653 length:618 start_codon:yes stop_codon:yes gene_type:complete